MQTVKDLSVEELRAVINEVVEEKLREILSDPDAGLAIRPEVRDRLTRDLREPEQEGENTPAAELARRRGLEWQTFRVELFGKDLHLGSGKTKDLEKPQSLP